jgi:outer membrane protein assembly factor BamE (lipoprotein component of BamABCDE complex)
MNSFHIVFQEEKRLKNETIESANVTITFKNKGNKKSKTVDKYKGQKK